jgi:elongation factor P--beta-lysine ligase
MARVGMDEPAHPVDEALIAAVSRLPRASGIAMGLDRLVAALMGWSTIEHGRVPATGR